MLGLASVVDGKPILKPWRLATNCPNLINKFRNLKCKGHKEHRPCEGRDIKITQEYTDKFVQLVHEGWHEYCTMPSPAAAAAQNNVTRKRKLTFKQKRIVTNEAVSLKTLPCACATIVFPDQVALIMKKTTTNPVLRNIDKGIELERKQAIARWRHFDNEHPGGKILLLHCVGNMPDFQAADYIAGLKPITAHATNPGFIAQLMRVRKVHDRTKNRPEPSVMCQEAITALCATTAPKSAGSTHGGTADEGEK